ncbi:MAG TPA: hypothetical protein VLG47_01935 [Candidatus Saccharimonadales bacterium]|nr:hypothetical protein [Candidatus Saccharimonadales bacterium]
MATQEAVPQDDIRIPSTAWSSPDRRRQFEGHYGCALASEASVFTDPAAFKIATLLAAGVVAGDPSFDGIRVIPHHNGTSGQDGWQGLLLFGADPNRLPSSALDQARNAALAEVDAALTDYPQAGNIRLSAPAA